MIFINKHGKIVYCNKRCEKIMGYSQAEFCSLNFDFFNLISPESKETVRLAFVKHQKGKEVEPYEYTLITKDGRKLDVIISTKLIQYERDSSILGIVTDITERKLAEKALRESQEKIARLQKMESLGLLAGGVAHDLNNVLSGIVSYPDLLLLDLPEDSSLRNPIETMKKSGHRAVAIVQDLLTVARGVATMIEPLNLNDIV